MIFAKNTKDQIKKSKRKNLSICEIVEIKKNYASYQKIWLVMLVILFFSFSLIQAQTENSSSISKSSSISFSNQSDYDEYKILFAPSYEGKLRFSWKENVELKRTRHSSLNNFIEQLNIFGERGYKLLSSLNGDFALVKLDEAQYEYDWLETISSVHFAKNGLQEKLIENAGKRFRVVDHSLLSKNCELTNYEFSPNTEMCEYIDLFLLEKEKNSKKPVEQVLVSAFPGWGAKPSDELEKQIDQKLAEGFYPVSVLSPYEILLERAKDKDELLSDKPDVQVVRTLWGKDNLEEKVNDLAKQGYRLAMTNNRIAVMYRNQETKDIPVAYLWLKSDKKNFLKDLAKLQEQGAIYKTTYPDDKGVKNTLIFEQKLKDDGKRSEFKVLKLEFDYRENKAEYKVYVDLKPESKEAVKKMNELVKEGFEARDLFDADGISIILERRK